MNKVCLVCGKEIVKRRSGKTSERFCGPECSQKDYRDRNKDVLNEKTREKRRQIAKELWDSKEDVFCALCGSRIEYSVVQRVKYCSEDCARIGNYKLPEAKEKRRRYNTVYVNNNREKINYQRRCSKYVRGSYKKRLARIKHEYGLSEFEYVEMLNKQKGCCAICETSLDYINVDHCHESGSVRELLCGNCNSGLGHFKDNVNILEKAIDYIKRHKGF